MKVAAEFWGPPATLTRIKQWASCPADCPNTSSQRGSLASPMWCGHGRLAVRWPVWQVVLFNMSVRWSNHSVWYCFSFSIHAYIWPNQQSSLQVATHCPHAEKVQPLVHHFFIIFVVGREKEGGGKLVFYFTGTNICYRCLVLYMLQYGLSALVNWVVSGGLILAVWVWSENDLWPQGFKILDLN